MLTRTRLLSRVVLPVAALVAVILLGMYCILYPARPPAEATVTLYEHGTKLALEPQIMGFTWLLDRSAAMLKKPAASSPARAGEAGIYRQEGAVEIVYRSAHRITVQGSEIVFDRVLVPVGESGAKFILVGRGDYDTALTTADTSNVLPIKSLAASASKIEHIRMATGLATYE